MMRFLRLTKTGNRDLQNILTNNIDFDSEESFESLVLLFVKKHFPAKQKIVPDLITPFNISNADFQQAI
jgi:hypothetical protein